MTQDITKQPQGDQPTTQERDLLPELGLTSPVKPRSTKADHPGSSRVTEFDGHQAPEGAPDDTFSPQDDTPALLKKEEGPRN